MKHGRGFAVASSPGCPITLHARPNEQSSFGDPADNITVLSWSEDPATQERWPMEWVVEYGQGRIYSSTFGHVWRDEADPVGMRCAGFQTILVRALQWLAKRPVTYPVPADFPGEDATALHPVIAVSH